MSPYLLAHSLYQSQHPDIPWTDALDFHLQHGTVISTPEVFLMLRPVRFADADVVHLSLTATPGNCDALHLWMAAGNLRALLRESHRFPMAKWITFTRRDGRMRRWRLEK